MINLLKKNIFSTVKDSIVLWKEKIPDDITIAVNDLTLHIICKAAFGLTTNVNNNFEGKIHKYFFLFCTYQLQLFVANYERIFNYAHVISIVHVLINNIRN